MTLRVLLRPPVVAIVLSAIAIVTGLHRFALGPSVVEGQTYTHYNNFVLFRASFLHLVQGQDLYVSYPQEYLDLYKYSPTFAMWMAPFAAIPAAPGLILWNLLGGLLLFAAIWLMPVPDSRARMTALWFVMLPVIQSMQNSQSNTHLAALMILTYVGLERHQPARAALAVALACYLKVYGGAAVVLAVMYPTRTRFALYSLGWMLALGLLPLVVVSPAHLVELYQSWARLIAADQSASVGVSVMSWLHNWFALDPPALGVMTAGLLLTLAPLCRVGSYADPVYRLLVLAAVLIFSVIFNHKAEPNTFVIATVGVAIWYFAQAPSALSRTVLGLVFVFTCLSTTDLFPTAVRRALVQPYSLRVTFCIAAWALAVHQTTFGRRQSN